MQPGKRKVKCRLVRAESRLNPILPICGGYRESTSMVWMVFARTNGAAARGFMLLAHAEAGAYRCWPTCCLAVGGRAKR